MLRKRKSYRIILLLCSVLALSVSGGCGFDITADDAADLGKKALEGVADSFAGGFEKPFADFGNREFYEGEIHTPEKLLQANRDFLDRITYGSGVGDFGLTPLKYGESLQDFSLILENNNSYAAGAYVTFVFRDDMGKVLSAGEKKSRVLAPGARDVLDSVFGEGSPEGFDSLEITAFVREGMGEGIYENVPSDAYKEVGNARTGKGRRIDILYDEPHGQIVYDQAVFYDSDGNVYRVQGFVSSEETACIYTEFEYADYEIIAWNKSGTAMSLPREVYEEYRKGGYLTGEGKPYENLDGMVSYSFEETRDGIMLLHCKNLTDQNISFRKDCYLLYGTPKAPDHEEGKEYLWNSEAGQEEKAWARVDEERGTVYELQLKPKEELYWDIGIPAGEQFYLFPFSAHRYTPQEPVPKLTVSDHKGSVDMKVEWGITSMGDSLRGELCLVLFQGDEIVSVRKEELVDGYEHEIELEANIDVPYEACRCFMQYRYLEIPQAGAN